VRAGALHYFGETDYLLFTLCVLLVFRQFRGLLPSRWHSPRQNRWRCSAHCSWGIRRPESAGLLASSSRRRPQYVGIEPSCRRRQTSQSGHRRRPDLRLAAFALGLRPMLQFGGVHTLASALGFTLGIAIAELLTVTLLLVAVQIVLKLSRAPRMAVHCRILRRHSHFLAHHASNAPMRSRWCRWRAGGDSRILRGDWRGDALDPGGVQRGCATGSSTRLDPARPRIEDPTGIESGVRRRKRLLPLGGINRGARPEVRLCRPET